VKSKDEEVMFKDKTIHLSSTLQNSLKGLAENLCNIVRGNNQLYLNVVQSLKRDISELSAMKQS
jgi:hypothetical protein